MVREMSKVDSDDNFTDGIRYAIPICILLVFELSNEIWQMIKLKSEYISFINAVDLFQYLANLFLIVNDLLEKEHKLVSNQTVRIMCAWVIMCIYLKMFDWLRMFETPSKYVSLIINTV